MNAKAILDTTKAKSFRFGGLATLVAFAALAPGCASTPAPPIAPSALDCGQIRAAIADAAKARRAATEKQQDAWKAVIPFAVVARYARGKSAVSEADAQLAQLERQSAKQGCAS